MMTARGVERVDIAVVAATDQHVLIELSWAEPTRDGRTERLWQLVTVSDGRIVELQDYRKFARALNATR
jgi:hypothetical protein